MQHMSLLRQLQIKDVIIFRKKLVRNFKNGKFVQDGVRVPRVVLHNEHYEAV
jgi:hypothetical protein